MIEYEDATEPDDEDEVVLRDSDTQSFVVLIGNLSFGFRSAGPFDEFDKAADWARETIGDKDPTWVMNIFDPDSKQAAGKQDA